MQWLNKFADEIIARQPEGEILVESGGSPSGTHHIGHLRELVISDAIMLELRRRGRVARHIYFVDDLDALRKVPVNLPEDYKKYLGMPLCDIPSPSGEGSYADYFLQGLVDACEALGIEVEFIRSHKKYREGFFVPAIERALLKLDLARNALETISGRKLDEQWSPIQVMEDGYLKKRPFVGLDQESKSITYLDKEGNSQTTAYDSGQVKLDWRLDWPGRWWLMEISAEPFGRDHSSSGSSYDTGVQLMRDVYEAPAPYPIPYDFINLVGDTKKMSASKGTGIDAAEGAKIMPAEVWRYFILRSSPSKLLFFDPINGVIKLMDEFAELLVKPDKTAADQQLIEISTKGIAPTLSNIPFSHLVASYQAALRNPDTTLEVISRTEHSQTVRDQAEIIKKELVFIDQWLSEWAPEDVKFDLQDKPDPAAFSDDQRKFLAELADKITTAPADADGEWFHKAIYEFKETQGLQPTELFIPLYKALIGKERGPRAGWFLSTLPREWLVKRLRFEA